MSLDTDILLKESKKRIRKNRPKPVSDRDRRYGKPKVPAGVRVPDYMKKMMIEFFKTGKYSISEVARHVGTSYATAKRVIDSDPILKSHWETAFNFRLDQIEEAMTERAISARNEIAAQQAGEFLLKHHRKSVYSDDAVGGDSLRSLPKIIIPLVINRNSDKKQIEEAPPIDVDSTVG